jgi:hypothetical protein
MSVTETGREKKKKARETSRVMRRCQLGTSSVSLKREKG